MSNHPYRLPKTLPKREQILRRTFKMSVNANKYKENQFHDFCNWAKGKSESALIQALNS